MNFNQDFFALFNLPRRFALDRSALDTAYRQIQGEVHPDRFAASPEAERRLALQWATRANEAHQTLRQPLARARYLLALAGVDTAEDTNTAMPAEFLMLQMEWREAMMDARAARDADALETLIREVRADARALEAELAAALDDSGDFAAAASLVRKLRFLEKLEADLGEALEALLF